MPFDKLVDNSPVSTENPSRLACMAKPGDVMAWLEGDHILRRSRESKDFAEVLDVSGQVIGHADRYTYGDRGWAVHTKDFAGFVPNHQIRYLED